MPALCDTNYRCFTVCPVRVAEACDKSSRWFWNEKLCLYLCEKARKHMCVTDRHDMTLAVKVALNPNTTNQPSFTVLLYVLCNASGNVLYPFSPEHGSHNAVITH